MGSHPGLGRREPNSRCHSRDPVGHIFDGPSDFYFGGCVKDNLQIY